jgi:hypothetical protein
LYNVRLGHVEFRRSGGTDLQKRKTNACPSVLGSGRKPLLSQAGRDSYSVVEVLESSIIEVVDPGVDVDLLSLLPHLHTVRVGVGQDI